MNREIRYNRANRDYDLFLDGEYVGSAATYHDGENRLDAMVSAALTHCPTCADATLIGAGILRHSGLPNPLARIQANEALTHGEVAA